MQQNLKAYSGNRIVVTFDGQQVGMVQSANPNDDYAPDGLSGVGDIHYQEWVPTSAHHTLHVQSMVLKTLNLRNAGIAPENGDAVLNGNVFDFEVISKETGAVLRKYIGCGYASGNIQIRKHAIVVTDAVFNALDAAGTFI